MNWNYFVIVLKQNVSNLCSKTNQYINSQKFSKLIKFPNMKPTSQSLVLVLVPVPQLSLHSPNSLHFAHFAPQLPKWHGSASLSSSQSWEFPCKHFLVRVFSPTPQVREQGLQSDQSPCFSENYLKFQIYFTIFMVSTLFTKKKASIISIYII